MELTAKWRRQGKHSGQKEQHAQSLERVLKGHSRLAGIRLEKLVAAGRRPLSATLKWQNLILETKGSQRV